MAAISTMIAAASLAVAGVGMVNANKNAKKAAAEQQKAARYQRQQNDLQAARQKRDAIRQARLAYGTAAQNAENQGVANSSASMGGLGSIKSQLGDTLSFLDQYNFASDQASKAIGSANMFESRARTAGAVSDLGMTVFQNSDSIANIFSRPRTTGTG